MEASRANGPESDLSEASDPVKAPPPLQAIFAAVTLAALATLILLPVLGGQAGRRDPFLVAIAPPRIDPPGDLSDRDVQMLSATLLDAAERHLSGRTGLLWLSADATSDDRSAARSAQEAGADEVLVSTLSCGDPCRITLRRIRAVDGSTTWHRPSFRLDAEDPLQVERDVGKQIAVAYLKFPRRDGAPRLYARVEDYRRYLEIRRQLEVTPMPGDLADAMAAVRKESPRFFSTYLLEAGLRGRAGADAATVLSLLSEAHRIAPADPRPLTEAVPLLVQFGRNVEARDLINDLESLYPAHPQLPELRAQIFQPSARSERSPP
ncbi:MAG: hypothetical protein MPN21_26155 [Thermoanaerobaculia bacterium]|nr:hypothetical protein [Thermoanaerobaculia bacterium]